MNKLLFSILILLSSLFLNAQKTSKIFKGTINHTIKISLLLISGENECTAEEYFYGIYKYDSQEHAIPIFIKTNKNNFIMVEKYFTGVLFLQKTKKGFQGNWISPDQKKNFEVELIEIPYTEEELEKMYQLYEEAINDC